MRNSQSPSSKKRRDSSFKEKNLPLQQVASNEVITAKDAHSSTLDPILYNDISKHLEARNKCTLCVTGIPPKMTAPMVEELVPNCKAYRLPWKPTTHTCLGVLFLEFATPEEVDEYRKKLDGLDFHNRKLLVKSNPHLPVDPG